MLNIFTNKFDVEWYQLMSIDELTSNHVFDVNWHHSTSNVVKRLDACLQTKSWNVWWFLTFWDFWYILTILIIDNGVKFYKNKLFLTLAIFDDIINLETSIVISWYQLFRQKNRQLTKIDENFIDGFFTLITFKNI